MKQESRDKILQRINYALNGEVLDRCCISLTVNTKNSEIVAPTSQEDLFHWYNDGEIVYKRLKEQIDNTYFAGDAIPSFFPYFGTGGHAKYLAPDSCIEYSDETIWMHPVLDDYDDFDFSFDTSTNKIFLRELEVLKYLADKSKGEIMVGMPDNCGSYDALAQLRGNEELLIDLLSDPDATLEATKKLVDVLDKSTAVFFDATKHVNEGGGFHGWMNMWSKGQLLQLQCDLSVMISSEMFDNYILEELKKSCSFLTNAIYHLDGMEQIRHLDSILSVDGIDMIQWVQVAGQPPATEFIPELKRIQNAGKGITIGISKNQIKPLLENLSIRGLNLLVNDASSPEEADDIMKYVSKFTK